MPRLIYPSEYSNAVVCISYSVSFTLTATRYEQGSDVLGFHTRHRAMPSNKTGLPSDCNIPIAEARITDLPTELLVKILLSLPYRQISCLRTVSGGRRASCPPVADALLLAIRSISQVCKRIKDLIDTTPAIQYLIERNAAGYKTHTSCTVGTIEALDNLRRNQRAYRNPIICTGEVQELGCGPLRADEWTSDDTLSLGDMVLLEHSSRSMLGILNLCSDVPDAERFRWIQFERTEVFAVSVAEDLIVFPGPDDRGLRFRSFTTGETPDKVLAVRGNDTPIPDSEFPEGRAQLLKISLWQDWVLIYMYVVEIKDYRHMLFHWRTGKLSHVGLPHSCTHSFSLTIVFQCWSCGDAFGMPTHLIDGFLVVPGMRNADALNDEDDDDTEDGFNNTDEEETASNMDNAEIDYADHTEMNPADVAMDGADDVGDTMDDDSDLHTHGLADVHDDTVCSDNAIWCEGIFDPAIHVYRLPQVSEDAAADIPQPVHLV